MVLSDARSDPIEEHVKRMRACSETTLELRFRTQSPHLAHFILQDTSHQHVLACLAVYSSPSEVTFEGKLLSRPHLSISV